MKKLVVILFIVLVSSTVLMASKVEGKWTATINTENGPFTFTAEYVVTGKVITGELSSEMGSVKIENGKISGKTFEYEFRINDAVIKHKGKYVKKVLEIHSSGDYGESDFKMTRIKKE